MSRGELKRRIVREAHIKRALFGIVPQPKRLDRPTHDGPYSVQEVATITRISERKIYADCADGKIRHFKNPVRIPKDALEAYQRERERKAVKTTGFRHL